MLNMRGNEVAITAPVDEAVAPSVKRSLSVSSARLRASFADVGLTTARLGDVFYERLFEVAPTMRHLFPKDMLPQEHQFTQALAALIRDLDDPASLEPVLQKMGERHAGYGVRAGHYVVVGEVLIDVLEQSSVPPMCATTREDWVRLYGWIAATMLAGAKRERDSAAPPRTP